MKNFFVCFLLALVGYSLAQVPEWENPHFRSKWVQTGDSIVLDSMFIIQEKIILKDKFGQVITQNDYKIDFSTSVLFLPEYLEDSVQIEYFVHPELRNITVFPKNPNLIVPSANENKAIILTQREKEKKEIFEGLQTRGNMVRGISFGNNQGSSVQSSLDLRINGQLSDNVGISAMISDTNVPIEADGYTQSLEQFDRVFVELFTDRSSARAGHVDLEQTAEYFGRFNRRVTGIHLKHRLGSEDNATHVQWAGSVARGEFKQHKFNGIEGNQGPYRLHGNHGEAFVIVLSGSEKIYKDGILLQRGENYDYVINYNTGEITFTHKHLVRATDRFTAEYQYTNRNYNRFTLYGGAAHVAKRFSISSHIYSESDNKHNPVNQTLSEEDQRILAAAGNDTSSMFVSSAEQVPYEEGKVLYRKILINNEEVFEYSTDSNEILYMVNFTQMGSNKGNYKLSDTGVNGRVFEYISPINGVMQGSFEPVRPLVAPSKKQIWSMATNYRFGKNGNLSMDAGVSNLDHNLFSDLDDEKNIGLAFKFSGSNTFTKGKIHFEPNLNYEFIQTNFSPIERLRSPEFARDFNLNVEQGEADQHYLQTNLNAFIGDSAQLSYGIDVLNQTKYYSGLRHRFLGKYITQKQEISAHLNLLKSETELENTNFNTYNIYTQRKIGKLRVGAGILGESNIRNLHSGSDSLSFRWNESFATAMLGDTISAFAQLRLYQRKDDSVRLSRLERFSVSRGAELLSQLIKKENHALRFSTHYRTLNYTDSTGQISFLNATLQWRKSLWKKAVDMGVTYEISGGTELQRAFTYVQVADGLGIYKWMDYNQDGIQQLDEFEVAEFSDQAQFIRVYTNTIDHIRTNKNSLGMSLKLIPGRYFGNNTFWHRIETSILYSGIGNYLKNNQLAAWNPWQNRDARSEVSQFYWQNKYNSAQSYQFKLTHELSRQRNTRFVFTGLESLAINFNKITTQFIFNQWLTAELMNRLEWVESDSDAFSSRRFKLEGVELVPKLYVNWSENLKSSVAYNYKNQENITGDEHLSSGQFNFEFLWNDKEKTSLLAGLDWVKNAFDGEQDSVVGNRMMEGLRDGNNLVWRIMFERNINHYLELNLQYSGRKNEDFKAIHSGNVQLKLHF
ncbi:MAG: hypothetical protein Q4G27_05765 [Flavobacteriaceae bacterium]|nr:hypothetical protein [Flavobacteriaceae bacterium]